jgi:hypothetical protein
MVSCEIRRIIADDEGNANILKYRNTSTPPTAPLKRGIYPVPPRLRASLSSPKSNTNVASRGLRGVQNNKILPPVREGVFLYLTINTMITNIHESN